MSFGVQRVFVDANVFFSKCLRDWLGVLSTRPDHEPPFQVFWTEDVLAEVIYGLRRKHPEWDGVAMTKIRDKIASAFEGGRVEDFQILEHPGPDAFDAHIHSAAIACGADILLTCNVKDFPERDQWSYEVMKPDEFFCLVDDWSPNLVHIAVLDQVRYWRERDGEADLPRQAKNAELPDFAERVRLHILAISREGHAL
ncbi:MAG: PIN domain-containing protein [Propionibacteriaceae bacterium]|jgi:predicted nucleic acid-binding protein|nr:PIN domain-containing protein [Micropruina sp.]HBX81544.1 PIN domain-containing protein [Propionibacteriaceae bacterium]HBY24509.1 PIN domain-containing protein [Propionibacteriaceae bacterium]